MSPPAARLTHARVPDGGRQRSFPTSGVLVIWFSGYIREEQECIPTSRIYIIYLPGYVYHVCQKKKIIINTTRIHSVQICSRTRIGYSLLIIYNIYISYIFLKSMWGTWELFLRRIYVSAPSIVFSLRPTRASNMANLCLAEPTPCCYFWCRSEFAYHQNWAKFYLDN